MLFEFRILEDEDIGPIFKHEKYVTRPVDTYPE